MPESELGLLDGLSGASGAVPPAGEEAAERAAAAALNTINAGLGRYKIGQKIRRLRLRKGMGLVELGRHTGLSSALLSKLERGIMHPTLPTLLRISLVFSVGLEYFFNPDPRPVVALVRKGERLRFPAEPGAASPAYHFESLDFPVSDPALNAYYADFHPATGEDAQPHTHPGVELLYLLAGELEIRIGEESYQLAGGDALYFDSTVPHGYRNAGAVLASAVVVTTE
jgi:transcriptional regulator with XRE-family HTH domain